MWVSGRGTALAGFLLQAPLLRLGRTRSQVGPVSPAQPTSRQSTTAPESLDQTHPG